MDLETAARQPSSEPATLANFRDGTPERFVPGIMEGGLIEVDHLSRYHWASQFASGRRVLDIACGAGDGCVLLAEAGAELPAARPLLGITTRLDFHTWQKFLDGAAQHMAYQQRLIDAHEEEVRILRERIERADQTWRDVQASPSWRLTRPLHADDLAQGLA